MDRALRRALAEQRPSEARLANAPWRPFDKRAAPGASHSELQRFQRLLEEAPSAGGRALHLHHLGIALLLDRRVARAVAALALACELEPRSSTYWNDLAVARFEGWKTSGDPYWLILALVAIERAERLDPQSTPVQFNRALVLEAVSLEAEAEEVWRQLADREGDWGWRQEEGKRRQAVHRRLQAKPGAADRSEQLKDLRAPASAAWNQQVRADPQAFREYFEGELVERWARAAPRKDEAREILERLRVAARTLEAFNGERGLAEAVAGIDKLRPSGPAARRLAGALAAYSQGRKSFQEEHIEAALAAFVAAERSLASEGRAFRGWARYRTAECLYRLLRYREARDILDELKRTLPATGYEALAGRVLRLSALMDSVEGRPEEALRLANEAVARFNGIREEAAAARMKSLAAESLERLGRLPEAWRTIFPALTEPSTAAHAEARRSATNLAAALAQRQGEPEIALAFERELLRSQPATASPGTRVGPRSRLARLLHELGRPLEALAELRQAKSFLSRVKDPATRDSLEGDLLLTEGKLLGRAAPGQALRSLDRAVDLYRATQYPYGIGEALFERSLVRRSHGDPAGAANDLRAAIDEAERQRKAIDKPEDRATYLDRLRAIYDAQTLLELDEQRDPVAALRSHERARDRVLWETLASQASLRERFEPRRSPGGSIGVGAEGGDGLPADTTVLEYAVFRERTLVWILRRGRPIEVRVLSIQEEKLDRLARRFLDSLKGRNAGKARLLAERLFDALIRPLEPALPAGGRLVVIPDRSLHLIPFSALRDRVRKRYLVESLTVSLAPSFRTFEASLARCRTLGRRSGPALIVAAPDFDGTLDPSLGPLRAGAIEARIPRRIPGSRLLAGAEARRTTFLRLAPAFDQLYFGGHAIVNPDAPAFSLLLFARDPGDPQKGALYAEEILRYPLPHTDLVVLASCRTGSGALSSTEGVLSLARPFQALGVPNVVASLWPVDDVETAQLFERFYLYRQRGLDAAQALRQTKIDLLKRIGTKAPWRWAAFELVGAGR